ncbi:MAG: ribonuclease P protein component [Bacteroidota bacterium]
MAGPPTQETGHYRLPRAARLKRQRLIRPLFDRRRKDVHAVRVGTLLVRYRLAAPEDVSFAVPLQVGFATGRHLGSKPTRNRIKRLLRESFRLHQQTLADAFADRPETLTLMVLYRGRTEGASAAIRRDLPEALYRIAADFAEPSHQEA